MSAIVDEAVKGEGAKVFLKKGCLGVRFCSMNHLLSTSHHRRITMEWVIENDKVVQVKGQK